VPVALTVVRTGAPRRRGRELLHHRRQRRRRATSCRHGASPGSTATAREDDLHRAPGRQPRREHRVRGRAGSGPCPPRRWGCPVERIDPHHADHHVDHDRLAAHRLADVQRLLGLELAEDERVAALAQPRKEVPCRPRGARSRGAGSRSRHDLDALPVGDGEVLLRFDVAQDRVADSGPERIALAVELAKPLLRLGELAADRLASCRLASMRRISPSTNLRSVRTAASRSACGWHSGQLARMSSRMRGSMPGMSRCRPDARRRLPRRRRGRSRSR